METKDLTVDIEFCLKNSEEGGRHSRSLRNTGQTGALEKSTSGAYRSSPAVNWN